MYLPSPAAVSTYISTFSTSTSYSQYHNIHNLNSEVRSAQPRGLSDSNSRSDAPPFCSIVFVQSTLCIVYLNIYFYLSITLQQTVEMLCGKEKEACILPVMRCWVSEEVTSASTISPLIQSRNYNSHISQPRPATATKHCAININKSRR